MTSVDEIEDGIFRISTSIAPSEMAGGFTFNQYLLVDDEPLLFHTGMRRMFSAVRAAIATVTPPERLRYLAFSHFEADECGALNEFLEVAKDAVPVCGRVAAMTSVDDYAARPPRTLADGEELSLGTKVVRWLDTPHLPHGWECGYLFETTTKTLLCGDLFTQSGADHPALTKDDVFGPAEAALRSIDYFARTPNTRALLEKLAALQPTTLACMHGSAWRGDGAALLLQLADVLEGLAPDRPAGEDGLDVH